jgi:hypothetical protein
LARRDPRHGDEVTVRDPKADALALLDRGFAPIPVPHREKAPRTKAWQTLRLGRDDVPRYFNVTPSNVGVLLGEPSGWLVDVDLDHARAVALADKYLPHTGMTWGRESKPRSHRVYRLTRPANTSKWGSDAGMIVELRSSGCQTIAPGSIHPSGEPVRWDQDGEPASIEPDELVEAIDALARAVNRELGTGTTKYARAGLRREVERVASTPEGARNDALNSASFNVGTLIGAGELVRAEAEVELLAAALASGLASEEAQRTIASGMEAGIKQPRDQRKASAPMNGKDTSRIVFDRPFAPVAASELIAKHPSLRPPVVDGLLRRGETMNVVAAPKIGKSWLVHTLGVAIAFGHKWLDRDTVAGRVLLIDAELHQETLAHRLGKACHAARVAPSALLDKLDVWAVRGQRLTIDDILTRVRDTGSGAYTLLILDALYRFLPLDGEENANATMTHVYNVADAIADLLGAAVVLVHHSTKGSQAEKSVTDVGAGGGAQARAADTHLILRQHEADDVVVVDAAVRSWPPMRSFALRWMKPGWELAPELDPTKLRQPAGRRKKLVAPVLDDIPPVRSWTPADFARDIVGEALTIRDDIIAKAVERGLSKTQADSLLRRAEDAGQLHRVKTGHHAPHRFTTQPLAQQTLPTGEGQGSEAPATPEPCAPGGVGGAHAPPPPSRSTAENNADTG